MNPPFSSLDFASIAPMRRRHFLKAGCASLLGLGATGSWAAAEPAPTSAVAKAKSLIHIFLPGAMAQHESWDPKPEAMSAVRGEFGAIDTKLSGVQFGELLAKTAGIADKLTLLRGVWHNEAAHERGVQTMMTGWRPSPAIVYPSLGSVISHELGSQRNLPPYVCIPTSDPASQAGYLGDVYGPFDVGGTPTATGFQVRDLALPKGIDPTRFDIRRGLRDVVQQNFQSLAAEPAVLAMNEFYQKAYGMISEPVAREAFNLGAEPQHIREAYGLNPAGQTLLLARRLAQSGVRFITANYGFWDHHKGLRKGVQEQLPAFDQAFAALISDLDAQGLLDEVLVVVSSDFGRTPKMNIDGGRDHWTKCFSVVMAGAGLKRGMVHGVSDSTGAEPLEGAVAAEDYGATVLQLMGMSLEKRLMAPGNRPMAITSGKPVQAILA